MSISSDTWRRLFLPHRSLTAYHVLPHPDFHARDCLENLRRDFDRLVATGTARAWPRYACCELLMKLKALRRWGTEDDLPRLLPLCAHPDPELQTLVVKCILKLSPEAFPSQLLPIIELSWPEASHYALLCRIERLFDARMACGPSAEPHPEHHYWKPLLAPYLALMLGHPELSRRVQALMLSTCSEQPALFSQITSMLADWTTLRCQDWDDLIEAWRMEETPSNEYILTVHRFALEALCRLDLARCFKEGWVSWESLAPPDIKTVLSSAFRQQPALPPELFEPLLNHPQACIRLQALILQDRGLMTQGKPFPESVWLEYLEPEQRVDLYRCRVAYPVRACVYTFSSEYADWIRQFRDERLLDGSAYQASLASEGARMCEGSQKELPELLLAHFKERQAQILFSFAFCCELLSCSSKLLQAYGLELLAAQGWPETPPVVQSWLQAENASQRCSARRALCLYQAHLSGRELSELQIAWLSMAGRDEALTVLLEQDNPIALLKLVDRYLSRVHRELEESSDDPCAPLLDWLVQQGGPEILSRLSATILELFPGGKAWTSDSENLPLFITHASGGLSDNPDNVFWVAEKILMACYDAVDKEQLRRSWRIGLASEAEPGRVKHPRNHLLGCMIRSASREDADEMIPVLLGLSQAFYSSLKAYLMRILGPEDMPDLLLLLHPANKLLLLLAQVAVRIAPELAREQVCKLLADYNLPNHLYKDLSDLLTATSSSDDEDGC